MCSSMGNFCACVHCQEHQMYECMYVCRVFPDVIHRLLLLPSGVTTGVEVRVRVAARWAG